MAREMSYMEMGSTHVSVLPKGVSPLEDEIWKQRLPALVWSRIRSWYLLDLSGLSICPTGDVKSLNLVVSAPSELSPLTRFSWSCILYMLRNETT